MKSTRFFKVIIICLVMALALPASSTAINTSTTITAPLRDSTQDGVILSKLVLRVTEIQNIDKSNLSSSEKKALRKELKEMKKTADGLNKGVYLSVGAIIIIILLLILILR